MTIEQRITSAVLKREAAERMSDNPLKSAMLLEVRLSILAAKNDRQFAISEQYRADLKCWPQLAEFKRALARAMY